MKAKIFFLLAAIMFSCASAFAQSGNSDPLKGDVNEDGVVDVADIAAIIEIMKNGGGIVDNNYYWYVGKSIPESINGDGWTLLGTDLSGVSYIQADTSNDPDYTFPKFYVVLPTSLNFKPYNTDGSKDESALWTPSTWSVNNAYTVWSLNDNTSDINSRFKKEPEMNYYFSVGTDAITSDNYTTVNNATTDIPTTQEFTNNSGRKSLIYILVPSNKTVTATDLAITSIISPLIEDTSITIPNHKVYVTDGKIANGGGIKITIS